MDETLAFFEQENEMVAISRQRQNEEEKEECCRPENRLTHIKLMQRILERRYSSLLWGSLRTSIILLWKLTHFYSGLSFAGKTL